MVIVINFTTVAKVIYTKKKIIVPLLFIVKDDGPFLFLEPKK